jgi:hypothetical protein
VTGQNATGLAANVNVTLLPECPCRRYESSLDPNLERADPEQAKDFLDALQHQGEIEITASPLVATSIAMVDGKPHIYLANFAGLRGGVNAVPTPQKGITLRLRAATTLRFLPFLGEPQTIRGQPDGGRVVFRLPDVDRGAVAWVQK